MTLIRINQLCLCFIICKMGIEIIPHIHTHGLQNHCRWCCSHEIKRRMLLARKVMTNLDSILRSRDITLPTKVQSQNHSQSYGFFSSHIQMWEVDYKESWALKNWCFWTVVLENTLENPLDYKEIKPVNPKGNQSWILTGRADAEAQTSGLWPPDAKNWTLWKRSWCWENWRQEEKRTTEDKMVEWHHWLDGHEFKQALEVGGGQGNLACCSPWDHKESNMTEWLKWTESVLN